MDVDDPLEFAADLEDRDEDGRVRVPSDALTDGFIVGLSVAVRDQARPMPLGGAVAAGNLIGYGVLEQSSTGTWCVRLRAVTVEG